MGSSGESDSSAGSTIPAKEAGKSLYEGVIDVVMNGVAIILPVVVTLYLLAIALEFVRDALVPLIGILRWLGLIQWFERVELVRLLIELGVYRMVVGFLTELITLGLLFGLVVLVGTVGHNRYGKQVIRHVDLAISAIPGIGTVYKSFRRMGDVVLDDEAENFQDVKLVQCLDTDMYVIGFETSRSPAAVESATGHEEMVALFIPMAPNPVTGGFLTHVPESRVMDVDLTIEEGVRSILTSGVAVGDRGDKMGEATVDDLGNIANGDAVRGVLGDESDD